MMDCEMAVQPVGGRSASLHDDVLADILSRLAPRDLAVMRGVCRAWHAVIDGSRLLRADLLPLSLGGIFIDFNLHMFTEYFSNPSTSPAISSMTDYVPFKIRVSVLGHCNGLLWLDGNYVVNPATRWWARVPPPSHPLLESFFYYGDYLVFDPTISAHYEVFSIPHLHGRIVRRRLKPVIEESEWPPSSCTLPVFSSRTNGWEERPFVRDGEAAGTVARLREGLASHRSVYHKGVLYVQCEKDFVMRISLSESKYQAIKPPPGTDWGLHLGKSKDGVYFASLDYSDSGDRGCLLRIWVLNESSRQAEWSLKYHADLTCVANENLDALARGPWVLQDVNYNFHRDRFSNDDHRTEQGHGIGSFRILGFHPFEEVVFFSQALKWGLAYHLNTSKVEYLGYLYPTKYEYFAEMWKEIMASYVYTPCWM